MTGIKRNLEGKIRLLLSQFPVVAILGPRQVGKTTLAQQITPGWKHIDLENPQDFDRLTHDPLFFFEQYPDHVFIDEAQMLPSLFSILRHVIDANRTKKGRFLITGSSSLALLRHVTESLAGRIAIVELGTLKINEILQTPLNQFYTIFEHKLDPKLLSPFIGKKPSLINSMISKIWLLGGYPEPVLSQDRQFYLQWMESYQNMYLHRDISKLFPRLNLLNFRRFLGILSKLSGTIINKRDVARALEVSEPTVREYMDIIEGTFFWRQLHSFEKNIIKSVIKMPKGYVRDSGVLHHMLMIDNEDTLYNSPIVGSSFEGFVIEELIKGLQATMVTNWKPYYYRTRNGAEIDLIIEGPFGTLPIEIKYGSTTPIKQLTAVSNFIAEHDLPFGLLINQSKEATWLTPSIFQLPIDFI